MSGAITKRCTKCGEEKPLSLYYPLDSGTPQPKTNRCIPCTKEYHRNRYVAKKPHILGVCRDYRNTNKEKRKETVQKYYNQNREFYRGYHRQYVKSKRHRDPQFDMAVRLRRRLGGAVGKRRKGGSAIRDLGCSMEDFRAHIESQFAEGMTWENRSEWHLDHIIPLSSFDLMDQEQLLRACHYTNIQPLWAADNLRKGAKIN